MRHLPYHAPRSVKGTAGDARNHRPRIVILAAAALAALTAHGTAISTARAQQQPPATVVAARVVEREVASGQTLVGTIKPLRRSTVGSAVDGRVAKYPLRQGNAVRKGDVLAELLTETVEIELAAAKAELELRRQSLAELENGSRPEEIDQAKARLEASKALMDFTDARRTRLEALYRQNQSIAQDELEEAISKAVAALQVNLEAQAAYELTVQGPRKEKIEQARASVSAQEEAVRQIEDRLAKYVIYAPFDGYVSAEHTEVGEWIARADPIAEVIELDPIEIEVAVPESTVARLRLGSVASVLVPAVPGAIYDGTIAAIVPQGDERSRTFPVKVRLANPRGPDGHLLKAGMLARVTFLVGDPELALLVPKDALQLGDRLARVYVVAKAPQGEGTVARPVDVIPGASHGSLIAVRGELSAGEQVVIQGNERLRPFQPIAVSRVEETPRDSEATTPKR